METEKQDVGNKRLSLAEAFSGLPDPRVAGRSKHDLVEMLVVTVCALLCGVDDFVGIEAWANITPMWCIAFPSGTLRTVFLAAFLGLPPFLPFGHG